MWPSFSFKITSCIFAVINSKFLPLFHTQHHHLHEGKIPSHCLYYETHHWSSVKIINNKGLTLLHILLNTSFLSSVEKLLSPCVQLPCDTCDLPHFNNKPTVHIISYMLCHYHKTLLQHFLCSLGLFSFQHFKLHLWHCSVLYISITMLRCHTVEICIYTLSWFYSDV